MAYNKNRKKENVYFSKNLFHFSIFPFFHFTVFKSCLWETHICFP